MRTTTDRRTTDECHIVNGIRKQVFDIEIESVRQWVVCYDERTESM